MAHDPPSDAAAPAGDDLSYLAEIDAEFAALEAEIERISTMPRTQTEAKLQLLKQLREQWQLKAEDQADKPLWRRKIDAAVGPALEKILEDSLVEDGAGNMQFNLSNSAMQQHGKPILGALVEGFRDMLTEKVAKATPDERAKNPFMGALAALLAQLPKDLGATLVGGQQAGVSKVRVDGEQLTAETDLSTSVEGRFKPESAEQANEAGKALFQNLLQGLGQVMNTMGTTVKAPGQPAPAKDSAAQATASSSATSDANDGAGDASEKPDARPAPKVNIDFAGLLGSLFKQATTTTKGGKTTVSVKTADSETSAGEQPTTEPEAPGESER